MDVEETKKLARNKIKVDDLTHQVRNEIKTTKWEKQDMREGFREIFKPITSSQSSIKKSIDEKQDKTIDQLKENQSVIKTKLEQINETNLNLAELAELPDISSSSHDPRLTILPLISRSNIEKYLNREEIEVLREMRLIRPKNFFDTNPNHLKQIYNEIGDLLKEKRNYLAKISKQYRKEDEEDEEDEEKEEEIEGYKRYLAMLNKYNNILGLYLTSIGYKMGQGMIYYNNPHQLLDRLELLGGSILAGNNGVIPEFSQIAHLLNQMKVISKKQLNDLLKSYITIK